MTLIPGVQVPSKIVPSDSLDTYATHQDTYGKGGWRSVADVTERDAITSQRRTEGMAVAVISDGKIYQLVGGVENIHWQELVTGGSTPDLSAYALQSSLVAVSGALQSEIVALSGRPVADWFYTDSVTLSANIVSLIPSVTGFATHTELANVSGALQSEIVALSARPVADIFRTEIASISANLQAQINSIVVTGGSGSPTIITSVDNSITITAISGGYDLSTTPASATGWIAGEVVLNDSTDEFTITHTDVDYTQSVPLVNIESTSNFYRYRIHSRDTTSFKVKLDATPANGEKLLWHMAAVRIPASDFFLGTEFGDIITDEFGNYIKVA